jgi:protein involved in polysaccharide export with SLBB domain
VKRVPEWEEVFTVSVEGEVKFPGKYPVTHGETLRDLMQRAGGFTEQADPKGAVFLRESLKEKEAEALAKYKQRLQKELVESQGQAINDDDRIAKERALRAQLLTGITEIEPLGRLVVDLPAVLENKKRYQDVVLRAGDRIVIPQLIQEVSIVGEVNYPTSHLYARRVNGKKYIQKSGGIGRFGDLKRTYVIGRDGDVRPLYKWRFFGLSMKNKIKPGDTIVVPVDVGRVSPMTYWVQVSQVLFQLATTAAALDTVGAL